MIRAPHAVLLLSLLAIVACSGRSSRRDRIPYTLPPPSATGATLPPGPVGPPEAPPTGRLPADVRPTHYTLVLEVVPDRADFAGTIEIAVDLARPRDVIWLHGRGLKAKNASVRPEGGAPIRARYEEVNPGGVAALRLERPVGAGKAKIRIDYEGSFGTRLEGLYRVQAAGKSYVFTQYESIYARQAFPCFDEPAFKTPWDVSLFVPKGHQGIGNTREIARVDAPNGLVRVTFATTEPLPTYLVATAVGPLDVVAAPPIPPSAIRKRPLPLRGIAAAGRGPELAYALANTPAILVDLENYFGVEYPYDKLDIVAVPDKGGAMENVGLVTFREWLLLVDEKTAPIGQKRAFTGVMAHELAHQWFGNLVTMPWWDDIWLNEAFATWMGHRSSQRVRPEMQADISLLSSVEGAMNSDSLVSARQIRQPVLGNDDIMNSFDGITYQKGGGVLSMFEQWMGPEVFQKGIQAYMRAHRHGSATADDLLKALSEAAQKDVASPFRTFLFQPGLPFIEAKLVCDDEAKPKLVLSQSRYLPAGSSGKTAQTWQVPVCARYSIGPNIKRTCTLLTTQHGELPLEGRGCPAWIVPNADAAGYYRWSLPPKQLEDLVKKGRSHLSVRERMTVAQAFRAGFGRGTTLAGDAMTGIAPFAREEHPEVATAPMQFVRNVAFWLEGDPLEKNVQAYAKKLYGPAWNDLGWGTAKKKEPSEKQLLRQEVLSFLAFTARDAGVRKEAVEKARAYLGIGKDEKVHPEAVDPNLVGIVLAVAGQDADTGLFETMLARFVGSQDEVLRGRLLGALSSVTKPELAARARELAFDPRLKVIEVMTPIGVQMNQKETRDAAWKFFVERLDALTAKLPPGRAGGLPWSGTAFCDRAKADEVERLFGPRAAKLEGGPRNLAGALESMRLCATRKELHLASARAFFKEQR